MEMGLGFCLHRYSAPHHITKDRSKWLRTCRYCKMEIVSWFDDEKGLIVEKEINNKLNDEITSTQSHVSTNQSESQIT